MTGVWLRVLQGPTLAWLRGLVYFLLEVPLAVFLLAWLHSSCIMAHRPVELSRKPWKPWILGQNAMAAGGTLANMPGARERHDILTLYPGKSDSPTKIRYYRISNAAINLIPSSFS